MPLVAPLTGHEAYFLSLPVLLMLPLQKDSQPQPADRSARPLASPHAASTIPDRAIEWLGTHHRGCLKEADKHRTALLRLVHTHESSYLAYLTDPLRADAGEAPSVLAQPCQAILASFPESDDQ